MSIEELFSSVPDPRRKASTRHPLPQLLLMITIAMMCGNYSYRAISRFVKRHQDYFTKELQLKHGVPSFYPIKNVLNRIDTERFSQVFNQWASEFLNRLVPQESIACDGKAIVNSTQNYNSKNQNYVNVVSLFAHKSKLVLSCSIFKNKKNNEILVVQELVKAFRATDKPISLDALHCQKNA